MMINKVVLFVGFSIVFVISFAVSSVPLPAPPTILPTYHLLVVQWPKAFCKVLREGSCIDADRVPRFFTIHGLWPQVNPSCLQPYFNSVEFRRPDGLADYWPNVTGLNTGHPSLGANLFFWGHEWNVHGRCQPTHTLNEYFQFALEIYKGEPRRITEDIIKKYNGGTGLVLAEEIRRYVQTEHHRTVDFICKPAADPKEKSLLLVEIYFNVSLNGELQDMVPNTNKPTCPFGTLVKFVQMPPIKSWE